MYEMCQWSVDMKKNIPATAAVVISGGAVVNSWLISRSLQTSQFLLAVSIITDHHFYFIPFIRSLINSRNSQPTRALDSGGFRENTAAFPFARSSLFLLSAQCISSITQTIKSFCVSASEWVSRSHETRVTLYISQSATVVFTKLATKVETPGMWLVVFGGSPR